MVPFLTFFFLFFSLSVQDICDRSFTKKDQELYKTILLRSKDSKTKLKYLERFKNCSEKPGVSIFLINGIPVAERLQCGEVDKNTGMEFFFKDNILCGRSVDFFPSSKVFVIDTEEKNIDLSGNWKYIEGNKKLLVYDSKAAFKEGQDSEDRILVKKTDGSYTNSIGKKMHPSFVFENGKWIQITPLRELFDLKVENSGIFAIEIVTESAIPFKKEELIGYIGLKAEVVEILTPTPSRYFIKGKNLKAVRIPSLNGKSEKKNFNGKYSISLSFPGIEIKQGKTFIEKNFEIITSSKNTTVTINLIIKSQTLTKDEIKNIRSILDNVTPFYHSQE